MSSTQKRDALVAALEAGLVVHGGGTPEQRHHGVLNTVNEVIAEALRNEADLLPELGARPPFHAGLELAGRMLRNDAAMLENGPWQTDENPPTADDLRRSLREYTVNALDTVGIDPDFGPDRVRVELLAAGLNTYATDAELESFQALRRQAEQARRESTIAALVHLLDKADTPVRMGRQAAMQDLATCGLPIPQATEDEWASAIVQRRERKDPER